MQMGINLAMKPSLKCRPIDIAALFAAYPGRVGCYYGTKSGPSYSDILARNREALGPSLPLTGPGWSGSGTVYTKTVSGFAGIGYSGGEDVVGKTFFVQLKVVSLTAGTQISVYTRSADGASNVQVAIFNVVAGSTYTAFVRPTFDFGPYDVWIDNSGFIGTVDLSIREITDWSKLVLFDDANGTVPVFSVFQSNRGRGLLLDASQGLVRGPELVTNRTTSGAVSGVPGTLPTGWNGATTFNGVTRSIVSVGSDYMDFRLQGTATGTYFDFVSSFRGTNIAVTANDWYEVDFSVMQVVAGAIPVGGALTYNTVFINGTTYVTQTATNVPRHLAQVPGSGVTNMRHAVVLTFVNGSTVDVTLRVFVPSVKKFPGNHMVQPTAAARGELSARYNVLPSSNHFKDFAAYGSNNWVDSVGIDGSDSFDFTTGGITNWSLHTVIPGASYTFSQDIALGTAASSGYAVYDQTNSAWIVPPANYSGLTSTLTRKSISFTVPTSCTSIRIYWVRFIDTSSLGTVFCKRPDLRLTADAIPSIPAYQRVTSATDYDDVGFPVYWRGQTDDWAKTRINPSGATKALVMWAGQKMSDAAVGMLAEASGDLNSNTGVFYLTAPQSVGGSNSYGFTSKGSIARTVTGSGYAAPIRTAIRARGDIANDISTLYVNGNPLAEATEDQGTGGYTEQDVYFGARAGTSLFANIRETAPPLILFQPTADTGLSASQIAALDKAYAKAAGVTL